MAYRKYQKAARDLERLTGRPRRRGLDEEPPRGDIWDMACGLVAAPEREVRVEHETVDIDEVDLAGLEIEEAGDRGELPPACSCGASAAPWTFWFGF